MQKFLITLLYSCTFQFCFSQSSFEKYMIDGVYDPVTVYTCTDRSILEGGERIGVSLAKRDSNGQTIWTHNYTISADCDLCSAYLTNCGQTQDGYFCAGKFDDFSTIKQSAFIAPLDSVGNLLWAKQYSTDEEPALPPILRQVEQGNYIIWLTGKSQMTLIKVNSSGNIIWTKRVLYDPNDTMTWCRAPYISPDGNSIGQGQDNGFYYFFSLNTNGQLNWFTQFVDDDAIDEATVISQVEGGAVLIGEYRTHGGIIRKLDAGGNYLWEKALVGVGFDHVTLDRIVATRDTTYFISGGVNGSPLFLRMNHNGDLLSSYIFPVDSAVSAYTSLDTISNNQVVINIATLDTFFFFKVKPALDSYCRFVPYNFTVSDLTPDFYTSKGGDVIDVASSQNDLSPNYQGGFSMEFNDYCEMVGINESRNKDFRIYPNPAYDHLFIEGDALNENLDATIYNSFGEKVFEGHLTSGDEQAINISQLIDGVYLLFLNNDNRRVPFKFVKQ